MSSQRRRSGTRLPAAKEDEVSALGRAKVAPLDGVPTGPVQLVGGGHLRRTHPASGQGWWPGLRGAPVTIAYEPPCCHVDGRWLRPQATAIPTRLPTSSLAELWSGTHGRYALGTAASGCWMCWSRHSQPWTECSAVHLRRICHTVTAFSFTKPAPETLIAQIHRSEFFGTNPSCRRREPCR